jgi:outer membrane protein
MPLYEGGITTARVSEAKGRKGLSNSQLEQKQREIEKITRNAYLDMAISPERSQATDRALEASKKAKLAMEKGYELGVVTIVDLLAAQKQLSQAYLVQHQARYRYFKTRTALLQQAGRLEVEELAKLNSWLLAENTASTADLKTVENNALANSKTKPKTSLKPTIDAQAKSSNKATDIKPTANNHQQK